jgi:IS605 OrfB family transposase
MKLFFINKDMNHLTYNVQLETSEEERAKIICFLEKQRDVVNSISQLLTETKPSYLSLKIIHDQCYDVIKNEHDVLSQVIIKSEQEVLANLKSAKTNKHTNHKQIEKKNLSIRLDKRLYGDLTQQGIKLSITKSKRTEFKFKLYDKVVDLFNRGTPCDPLLFVRNNIIYLALTFEISGPTPKDESTLGVDLGMRRLYVTSDGDCLKGKEYLKHKRRIRYNKRMSQIAQTKSGKRKLKKLKRKEANFSRNYVHRITNKILTTNKSIIVMEDLSKIKTKKNKFQNLNAKSQIPFYMLKSILSYKALLVGKRVETVNPAFTSQDDCRGLERGKRLGCRYLGVDGLVMDADWNASVNIAKRYCSEHPISYVPLDGSLYLIGRLLSTNQKFEDLSSYKPTRLQRVGS